MAAEPLDFALRRANRDGLITDSEKRPGKRWLMKISKTAAGFILVGGIAMTVVCGGIAASASRHVGSPADDLYYDVIGWAGTFGAFAGMALFFWGAKIFSARNG